MPIPFTKESALAARETIEAQKARYREHYNDDTYWSDLAAVRGIRMPPYYTRPSDQEIKHWLRVAKVSYAQFVDAFGWKDAEEFEAMNPTHGMKILAGLILEIGQENLRIKKMAKDHAVEGGVNLGMAEPPKLGTYKGRAKTRRAELAKLITS